MPNDFYGSFSATSPTDAFLEETSDSIAGFLAFFGAFCLIFVLFFLALAIVSIIAQWKLYQKAGEAG